MTLPTIEQLEALLADATPGPWEVFASEYGDFAVCKGKYPVHNNDRPDGSSNIALIALAPTLATQRIADAKRIAELEAALAEIRDRHVPDQPAADGADEVDYILKHYRELRNIARATLEATP